MHIRKLELQGFKSFPDRTAFHFGPGISGVVLSVTHLGAIVLVLLLGRRVDVTDAATIRRYYLFIWALFIAEYIIYPLAAVLA